MLVRIVAMREAISIPAGCRERYVPLDHPWLDTWRALGLVHCGVSDLVRGYRICLPQQRSLMLIATTRGRGFAHDRHGRVALLPGTLLVNPPGGAIEWGIVGSDWAMVWWYVRPSPMWNHLLAGPTRLQDFAHGELLSAVQDALIQRVAQAQEAPARQLGEVILSHLGELAQLAPTPDDPLGRLWAEVETRLHEPWPVTELARRMRVSVPSLQRLVRRRFGQSVHRLLVAARMRRALELVQRTRYPLRVIAEQVGYSDPFTLSAAMRRHFGRPPARLRPATGPSR